MRIQSKQLLRAISPLLLFLFAAAAPLRVTAQSYPPNGTAIPTVAFTGGPAIQQPAPNPPGQQSQWNMELAGHSDLQGRSAYQPIVINQDGRHIAYVGHHNNQKPRLNPLSGQTHSQQDVFFQKVKAP